MNKYTSIGIALCRRCPKKNVPQIFLVKKRVTYSFINLILGKYSFNKNKIKYLLDNISVNEKNLLKYSDFNSLWFHIWSYIPDIGESRFNFFDDCRNKFNNLLMGNKGINLKNMLENSLCKNPGWEIPKGRVNKNETYMECAIRELYEETNINKSQYNFLDSDIKINYSYQHDNNIFINKFYIAYPVKYISSELNYINKSSISEIDEYKWCSLLDLNYIDLQHENLYKIIKKILKIYKKYIKK